MKFATFWTTFCGQIVFLDNFVVNCSFDFFHNLVNLCSSHLFANYPYGEALVTCHCRFFVVVDLVGGGGCISSHLFYPFNSINDS